MPGPRSDDSPPEISKADPAQAPALCEPILRSVPEWFGIEHATRKYIEDAGCLPTWVARVTGTVRTPVAFITIRRHYPESAEIHCMAVHKDFHGQGIGTALVREIEAPLSADGVRFLQVKTQGPSRPCAEYARTLRFYRSVGFSPIEELHGLWLGIPALLLVKAIDRKE